jgi:small subunit ribosomal protein S20
MAADSGDAAAAADALKVASTKLDKAVSKGVIHKNNAANKKSSMAKKAASL